MGSVVDALQWMCLIPAFGGSVYALLCLFAVLRFRAQPARPLLCRFSLWPSVTILKPVCGLEKNLKGNLRSICLQEYPDFQVVFTTQSADDPAIPLLHQIQREFGPDRVSVVIKHIQVGLNGKVNNLLGGLTEARHEILVISDSDMLLEPDYLTRIVEPLADPEVGCVCALFKATHADRWYEKMELLTMNADFMPSVVFAHVTGSSKFCLGPSIALRRSTLKDIGGLESLADYLVEDYEIGRRIWASGKKMAVLPGFLKQVVDLKSVGHWWDHQVYWDQNTRAARPAGFFATVLTRSVPFALLFAMLRLGDSVGLTVLACVVIVRMSTVAGILKWGLQDQEGLSSLALLPFRDLFGLVSWVLAFTKRTVIWRGAEFVLSREGRLVPREGKSYAQPYTRPRRRKR